MNYQDSYSYNIEKNIKLHVEPSLFLQKKQIDIYYKIDKMDDVKNDDKLYLFQCYSWSFGHVLISCLINYSVYITYHDIFKDYIFSNIICGFKNHITDFMEIIAKIENKKIYNLSKGDYYFKNIAYENIKVEYNKLFPTPLINMALEKIKHHIFEEKKAYPRKIAIIKTSSILDGLKSVSRYFNKQKIMNICKNTNYVLLDHENMNLQDILLYIYNCNELLVSWGATAYFSIFLTNNQKCICFSSHEYKSQLNNENICFHKDLFPYKIIKKTISCTLNNDECIFLENEIKKI